MFYVVHTELMQKTGGFTPLFHELCDDYAVRRHARNIILGVFQGITPQIVETSVRNRQHYFAMMHRWMLFATLLIKDQSFLLQAALTIPAGFTAIAPVDLDCGGCPVARLIPVLLAMLVIRQVLLSQLHMLAFRRSGELSPVLSLCRSCCSLFMRCRVDQQNDCVAKTAYQSFSPKIDFRLLSRGGRKTMKILRQPPVAFARLPHASPGCDRA